MKIIEWEKGYPTEESLDELKKVLSGNEFAKSTEAFYAALEENYYADCYGLTKVDVRGELMNVWAYHTGGWSGNEDIIRILKQSWIWGIYLERYDSGGHYYFTPQKGAEEYEI